MVVTGIAAAPGTSMGKAVWLRDESMVITHRHEVHPDEEWQRYQAARGRVAARLQRLQKEAGDTLQEDQLQILETHLMLLDDPEVEQQVQQRTAAGVDGIEQIVDEAYEGYAVTIESLDDEYLSARAADVRELKNRLIRELLGTQSFDWSSVAEPVVVVADTLGPSQTLEMPKQWVKGIVLRGGSKFSHASIVARSLAIPAVVGCGDAVDQIVDGEQVAVKGDTGEVLRDLSEAEVLQITQLAHHEAAERARLRRWIGQPAQTQEGQHVEVFANIGSASDAQEVAAVGADGIGLFRTEFLLLNRTDFPTEDEQFEAYREVLQTMQGKPVVVRTFDIGGDKPLPYFPIEEDNPFLGYRGIRIGIDQTALLQTQMRALYRASAYGNLRIMFPMVATLEEVFAAKDIAAAARAQVQGQMRGQGQGQELAADPGGVDGGDLPEVPLGIMVETPAAVLMSDALAQHVDFFSIGTNDLTQYVMAADRGNSRVSGLANPYHPAVLRAISTVIQSGLRHGKLVGMCGEFAGESEAAAVLLGMGLREFSTVSARVLATKDKLASLSVARCEALAADILRCTSLSEVRARLASFTH